MTYELSIALELEAATPEEAVRRAEAILRDPAREPYVWDVRDLDDDTHATITIDAEDLA